MSIDLRALPKESLERIVQTAHTLGSTLASLEEAQKDIQNCDGMLSEASDEMLMNIQFVLNQLINRSVDWASQRGDSDEVIAERFDITVEQAHQLATRWCPSVLSRRYHEPEEVS